MRGVYIHIPFCRNICSYCDFCKLYLNSEYVNRYLVALEKEIKSRYMGDCVKSIYIGGGTPSSIGYDNLVKLFDIISIFNRCSDIEITIECNPEDITPKLVQLFYSNGVNRVSLGVQSFDDNILKELNRSHTRDMVSSSCRALRNGGIDNINIDLIYGVNEDISVIKRDLEEFIKLDIPHISYYSLILEKNTKMYIDKRKYINEDIEVEMYNFIRNFLESKGYNHYEISNYSRAGFESIHNRIYWENEEYYGFGLGAVSYLDWMRIINTRNFSNYVKNFDIYDIIKEDLDTRMDNEIMLGLRMRRGVSKRKFRERYDRDIDEVYDIEGLTSMGVLADDGEYISINEDYVYVYNVVIVRVTGSRK